MKIKTVRVTPVEQNCRLLINDLTKSVLVIDPGGDVDTILEILKSDNLKIEQIWLTHSHFDHCGGVAELKEKTGATLYAHPNESIFRKNVLTSLTKWQINISNYRNCPEPDVFISGGEVLDWGGLSFKALYTPGHSPGHLSFYCAEEGFVLSGDALFYRSIGRTDLPYGNYEELLSSIKKELLSLPDSTKVLSGHGSDTTIGDERYSNPYLQEL